MTNENDGELISFKNQDKYDVEIPLEAFHGAYKENNPGDRNCEERKLKYVLDKTLYATQDIDERREYQKEFAKEIVQRLLMILSLKERKVLDLLNRGILSNRDIASMLNSKVNAIYQVKFSIRKKTEKIMRFLSFKNLCL